VSGGESELATVVGLSTEGYSIASGLVKSGVETIIVDENLQMGMRLTSEIVSMYSSVGSLLEGETLVGLEPMDSAIHRAKYVFFTPKIRRRDQEAKAEMGIRFRDTAKSIAKGSTIIFCLPVGFKESRGNVSMVEKMSGLNSNEGFHYIYAPLKPRTKTPLVLGVEGKVDKKMLDIFKQAGIKAPQPMGYDVAELICFREVLASCLPIALDLEVCKKIGDRDERSSMKKVLQNKDVYIDNVMENLFDLRFALGTLDTGDPALYLASGVFKSVEGYAKYLVDEIRQVMREKDLKASRTKVTLAWSVDQFEMRGERLAMLEGIADRLRDYIGDVNFLNGGEGNQVSSGGYSRIMTDVNKIDLVIICSEQDQAYTANSFNLKDKQTDTIVVKADLFIDRYG
jgi:hypothetical protein